MDQKTVLIAGASRGLGLNFARKYLEEGWRVLAGVRGDGHPGENSIGGLKTKYPDSLYPLRMDLTDTASVEEAAKQAGEITERIELVINNAGIHGPSSREILEVTNLDECAAVYDVNAVGPLRVVKAFLPLIAGNGEGMIVNISSESGSIGTARREKEFDYCMSKAALNMATKLLDNYLSSRGIRVIAVHPGWMHTPMGGPEAPVAPEDAARGIAALALEVKTGARTGLFFDYQGNPLPW